MAKSKQPTDEKTKTFYDISGDYSELENLLSGIDAEMTEDQQN